MRFLADENVSHYVVERLRAIGFDVVAVGSTNSGASDSDVLATARRDARILITEDRDFGELVVRQRLEVQGVVLLELDRLSNVAEAGLQTHQTTRSVGEAKHKCQSGIHARHLDRRKLANSAPNSLAPDRDRLIRHNLRTRLQSVLF